jgi:glycine oxidase
MTPDVIVIGGGVIGLLSAWRMAQAGLSVTLFERGKPGAESSAAALGVLSPQAAEYRPAEYVQLQQASLALFPALADELRTYTGVDVELRTEGMLYAAFDDAEAEQLGAMQAAQHASGVAVKRLSVQETHDLEPALSEQLRAGLFFTATAQVDNIRLCSALALAAARAGVQIRAGQAVARVLHEGSRVTGVQVGQFIHRAGVVVVAAGSWSGGIEGLAFPVRPLKGQALALEARVIIFHIIEHAGGFVTPRRDGRLLVGATVEDAGFDKRPTAGATLELLAGAIRAMPGLSRATIRETWAGLRPATADEMPMLGPVVGADGLIAATGHYRSGILLAPLTAQLVTAWASGRPSAVGIDMRRFSPERFG